MLELLRDRVYIRYWLAVVASFLGDAMAKVTLVYLVARASGSPLVISLVVLLQLLPSGVLGAFVGPLADRLPKRALLVWADLARVPIVLAMIPFLDSVPMLLALTLLEGLGKAFFETARIAAVPAIVGRHNLASAVALFQSTNQALAMAGPVLAGVLVAAGSVPVVLVVNTATFAVSALLLGSLAVLREQPPAGGAAEPYWTALRTGVREILKVPSLRFLLAFLVPVMLVFGLFSTNVHAQLLTVFGLPAFEYGLAQAVLAAGSIGGALLGPVLLRRRPTGLLLASVASFGVVLVALPPVAGMFAIMAWCLLAGLATGLFQVPIANTLLRDLPEDLRGRGVGLLNTVIVNVTLVGVFAGGVGASLAGVTASLVAAGVVLVASAGAAAWASGGRVAGRVL
ncbi:MFS transporter [Thermoactinospora rubra]|uniref:MFS transporter n=1 Tax=Thermoactinospora rubra TaxID=1088767 RepID=UPI000A115350|nr:MFS transporter [Thermoactinospora rubra]